MFINETSEWGTKCDVSDSDHGMIVGARCVGLSISVTADLLGFIEDHKENVEFCFGKQLKESICCFFSGDSFHSS